VRQQADGYGVTQVPWKRVQCLDRDAACPETSAQSYVKASTIQAGQRRRLKKRRLENISTLFLTSTSPHSPLRPRSNSGECMVSISRPWPSHMQTETCEMTIGAPRRRPTAMRTVELSIFKPTLASGRALSKSPGPV